MRGAIEESVKEGSDIVCFSELATVGYPARDFLEFDDFIHLSENLIQRLCELSKDIAIVVGAPTRNPDLKGKHLYNSAYFIYGGKVQFIQHKTLLPTYDIFDEYRYFEPAKEWGVVSFKGKFWV
jgi:NAD+ synthase (glutamine-hydrolysing)